MINLTKYKKLNVNTLKAFQLKVLEYVRNHLTSRRFNNTIGKKIKFIDFVSGLSSVQHLLSEDGFFTFDKTISESKVAFKLRQNTSDLYVYSQIIEEQEYGFIIDFLDNNLKPYIFIDFGANVGITCLYLAAHFKNAKIFAYEPEPTNFEVLQENIKRNKFNAIRAFNEGIFTCNTILFPDRSFRDGELWSFKLEEKSASDQSQGLRVKSFKSVLEENNLQQVDFLKIDIEGGELALLNDQEFLKVLSATTRIFMIEIHPEIINYDHAKTILKNAGFKVFKVGGSYVGLNRNLFADFTDI